MQEHEYLRAVTTCLHCGRSHARAGFYCSDKCKVRACRRRRAGVPQNAYPDGARRGRVPLGQPTRAERAATIALAMRRL